MRRSIWACYVPGDSRSLLYGIERMGYRKAALVSTLTEAMRDKIVSKGIPEEKVVLFSDWARSELFQVPANGGGAEFRRSLGLSNELLVVHCGEHGRQARTRSDPRRGAAIA